MNTNNASTDARKPTTPVVFVRLQGEIVALFPFERADAQGNISSYAHIGQHSAAAPSLLRTCEYASAAEYAPLKRELESAPYFYNLRVINSPLTERRAWHGSK